MSKPADSIPSNTLPEPYLTTEVSDRLTQEILDAFNREGLTPHQARQALDRVKDLVDLGELVARKTSH